MAHVLEPRRHADTSARAHLSPSGLEDLFRELGALGDEFDPATLPALAARYGCDLDFEGTELIMGRHGLTF